MQDPLSSLIQCRLSSKPAKHQANPCKWSRHWCLVETHNCKEIRKTTEGFGKVVKLDMGFYTNDCFMIFWEFITCFGLGTRWIFYLGLLLFLSGSLGFYAFHGAIRNAILSSKQCSLVQQQRVILNASKNGRSHHGTNSINLSNITKAVSAEHLKKQRHW